MAQSSVTQMKPQTAQRMDGTREAMVARWTSVRLGHLLLVAGLTVLVGCADDGNGHPSHPGALPMASGQSCGSIRQELNALDRKGTQAKIEAATAGKKLAPAAQADADRYNTLLSQYLGARCHV